MGDLPSLKTIQWHLILDFHLFAISQQNGEKLKQLLGMGISGLEHIHWKMMGMEDDSFPFEMAVFFRCFCRKFQGEYLPIVVTLPTKKRLSNMKMDGKTTPKPGFHLLFLTGSRLSGVHSFQILPPFWTTEPWENEIPPSGHSKLSTLRSKFLLSSEKSEWVRPY